MIKFLQNIKGFSGMMLCFVLAVFIVKITEILAAAQSNAEILNLAYVVYGNIVSCGFISAVLFVLYLVLSYISKKTAELTISVLFGLMLLSEICLVIYHNSTGLLMGEELIIRPLWETMQTIRSFANIWWIKGGVVLWVGYVILSRWFANRNIKIVTALIMVAVMVISIPAFFVLQANRDEVTANKTWCFVRECLKKSVLEENLTRTEMNVETIGKYLKLFPQRQVVDKQYPLERKDNIENVLGQYFKSSKEKPNVVMIVVESLGADIFGVNDSGLCFTPFFDSLSEHSLLWTNCLATTPRSFGAIPAVTGSVPHGLKGFQFGNIPEHNSLITIMKSNGYLTNAFYAGNFSFDRIYDYLVEQKIDYMSSFLEEYRSDKPETREGTYWGYHDAPMFEKSLEIIKNEDVNQPVFDLFITITQHECLVLKDKVLQKEFYDKAEALMAGHYDDCMFCQKSEIGKLAATLYTDEAIRKFFKAYNAIDNQRNTIFVITGDHSMNLNGSNPLDAFHVPLIIWSPLLERSDRFEALVSHNDIAPSLTALLRDNFGLKTPKTVHWVSDGIDTSHVFRSKMKSYFLRYIREVNDFVYDSLYFTKANGKDKTFIINEDLSLKEIYDDDLTTSLNDNFLTMVSVDNYVYSNNKLTSNPIFPKGKSVLISDSIYCDPIFSASKRKKPSVMKPEITSIFNVKYNEEHQALKLVVTADIKYTGKVWQDQFTSIVVECAGSKMKKLYSSDYISKYIMNRDLTSNTWSRFELSKLISTENSSDIELKVYLLPTLKDEMWNPDHTVTLENVEVKVYDITD